MKNWAKGAMSLNKQIRKKDRKLLDTYHEMRCLVCGRTGAVGHHVRSKASGGDDKPSNLMPLCATDHTRIHAMGLTAFAEKHQSVLNWLLANGWQFEDHRKRWVNYDR